MSPTEYDIPMSEFAHTNTAPNQAVSWHARCQVTAKKQLYITMYFIRGACHKMLPSNYLLWESNPWGPNSSSKIDIPLSKGLRLSQGWELHREDDVNIFRTYLPGITHHKAKLFELSQQMCLCNSLTTYIITKTMNFTCLGFFVNFLSLTTPQKEISVPP